MSSEYEFEPIRGLPGKLPAGERLIWQGAPEWKTLATEVFHVRAIALYFALLAAWRMGETLLAGEGLLAALTPIAWTAPVALAAVGLLCGLAWLMARTTVYTITSRRIVLRFGVALPKAINIPFAIVESGAVKPLPGRRGDVAVTLRQPNKIAYLQLWPHARPWRMGKPEPAFRGIAEPDVVASILAEALSGKTPVGLRVVREAEPARASVAAAEAA